MNSRTKNATYNTIIGFMVQLFTVFLSFAERRIFVNFLSLDYLGINGLYSNILSLLSLSELGISSVVIFYLYKPVYENDEARITSIVSYFKKVYVAIACVMLGIGLCMIPFLTYVIDSDMDFANLTAYYIIFLLNSVVTIPIAPKIALLAAHQDQRLYKNVTLLFKVILSAAHILVLYATHNYIIYLVATLISTIFTQIVMAIIVDRKFPYLRERNSVKLSIDKQEMVEKIKSVMMCKIGATVISSTDNILISVLVSTVAVGLISSYSTIMGAVTAFLAVVNGAMASGVGNLSAENNKDRMYSLLRLFIYIYQIIGVFCALCMFFLSKDFVVWWLGEDYVVSNGIVIAYSARLWIYAVGVPMWTYRDANGLFEKSKYIMLINAAINLLLSFILGKNYGVIGIIIATSIADLLTTYFYDPYIVFKYLFSKSLIEFIRMKMRYYVISAICIIGTYYLSGLIPHSFGFMFVRLLLIMGIVGVCFFVGMINTEEQKELKIFMQKILKFSKL